MGILTDEVTVYPEVDGTDSDGNPARVPGATPIKVLGSMQVSSSTEQTTVGQPVTTTYRFFCDDPFPGGAFARVTWAGRDWDVIGEPRRWPGGGASHTEVTLQARGPEPLPIT